MTPHLSNRLWFPQDYFSSVEAGVITSDLTFQPPAWGNEDEPDPIVGYTLDELEPAIAENIGLPVYYGLKTFQRKEGYETMAEAFRNVDDCRADGNPIEGAEGYAAKVTPRDEKQSRFFDDLVREVGRRPVALAEAPTGSGKTIASLYAMLKLGGAGLAVVPNKHIAKQWKEAAIEIFGVPEDRVGTIREGKFDFVGKDITVAVIHNLVNKEAEDIPDLDAFKTQFRTVVADEVQNLGARSFSKVMSRVYARHQFAVSATPERRDGCEGLFLSQFGDPCVVHTGEAMDAKARVFPWGWNRGDRERLKELNAKPLSVIKKIVQANEGRNKFIADKVARLYECDRQILVISDEVKHLQALMGYCSEAGVEDEDMGLLTRTYYKEDGKKGTLTDEVLDEVKENCKVIFATYQMAKEGVDIPRLDAGIDAMPKASGTQVIGRIRRPLAGKPTPLWVTIVDKGIGVFERAARGRLRDYRESNVTIIEHGKT